MRALLAHDDPEIRIADLMPLALELAAWGSQDVPWLEAPPAAAFAQAQDVLKQLGGDRFCR